MPAADPQSLLDRARAGDVDALGALLEQFRPYTRMVARGAGRPDDADLVQDAFLVAHRAFPRFRGESVAQFVAWLRTLTRRTANARVVVGARELAVADLDQFPDAADAADHTAAARIAGALDRLPADMRDLLLGRFFDGLSYAELAGRLGRSEGALRVLHTRALRKLREVLAE